MIQTGFDYVISSYIWRSTDAQLEMAIADFSNVNSLLTKLLSLQGISICSIRQVLWGVNVNLGHQQEEIGGKNDFFFSFYNILYLTLSR